MFKRRCYCALWFMLCMFQMSPAHVWQLSNPTEGAPGFMRGFGENIYVGGENYPGLFLTRTAAAIGPPVVLSDSTYNGQSKKVLPLIAKSNDGEALVFWINLDNTINTFNPQWRARRIDAYGIPQGDEIVLPEIPTKGWWWDEPVYKIASNGQQIVFVWEYNQDIFYRLYNFQGQPITPVKQANQDTTNSDGNSGPWITGAFFPSAYMTDDGSFIIAWQNERNPENYFDINHLIQPTNDNVEIQIRRFDPSSEPLGDNFSLNQDSIPRVRILPAICMNETGTIFCYWLESDTSSIEYGPNVVRGHILGENFSLDLPGSGNIISSCGPQVAASDSGFAALWQQGDSLLVQAFNFKGEPLGHPLNVFNNHIFQFTLKSKDIQQYVIIWNRFNVFGLWGRLFNPVDGNLGTVQELSTNQIGFLKTGMADNGSAIALMGSNGSSIDVLFLNNDLEPQQIIERLNTDRGGAEHKQPEGVRLKNGNYLVVWTDYRNVLPSIYGQIFNSDMEKIGENFPIYNSEELTDYPSTSVVAHPEDGAILAYRTHTRGKDKSWARLQRITSGGELFGPAVEITDITNKLIWSVKVAIMPEPPYTVLATWNHEGTLYGKLFDADFNPISNKLLMYMPHGLFNLYSDNMNRFWMLGNDSQNKNLLISGYDGSLHKFAGPAQINDSTVTVNFYNSPQLSILPNGRMLAVWAQLDDVSSDIKDIYTQILDKNGARIGNNFRVSSMLIRDGTHEQIFGYHCSVVDSLFVVSWNTGDDQNRQGLGIVWLDQNGKPVHPPTIISDGNFYKYHIMFPGEQDRLICLHETQKAPNPIDIALDIYEPSDMNTSGWYNSPIYKNQDTLTWKKLSWLSDIPANTSASVFFRCGDNLRNGEDKYIPWQQVQNGQTENMPAGKNAQWRVELEGTQDVSPVVYDLIGEYDSTVGVSSPPNATPYTFKLEPVYPNPAKFQVTIEYELPGPLKTTISVFNILGQRINQWELTRQTAGRHTFHWKGDNMLGAKVANGIYFIKLDTKFNHAIRKIVYMQ